MGMFELDSQMVVPGDLWPPESNIKILWRTFEAAHTRVTGTFCWILKLQKVKGLWIPTQWLMKGGAVHCTALWVGLTVKTELLMSFIWTQKSWESWWSEQNWSSEWSFLLVVPAGRSGQQLHAAHQDRRTIPTVQRTAGSHETREGPGDPEAAGENHLHPAAQNFRCQRPLWSSA